MAEALYAGLMSGTSLDGVDACLAGFPAGQPIEHAHAHRPFDPALREGLLAACRGDCDLATLADLDIALADVSTTAVAALLADAGIESDAVRAIGHHGQTVLHRPDGARPTSIQLGDPHRIAVRTGIDTVADFRRADVAAGGQGAPLAPAFHAACFAAADEIRAVVNLGGIANITLLRPGQPVLGFDTGPANILLDAWIGHERGERYDHGGAWAAGGSVDPVLLERLHDDDWFRRPPPKSTGRELFDLAWLEQRLAAVERAPTPADIQATLAELTALTVAEGINRTATNVGRVLVCGGGAANADLLRRLRRRLGSVPVTPSSDYGFEPQHVEAMAFAWLARQRVRGWPGNCPSVTGAKRELILGALVSGR